MTSPRINALRELASEAEMERRDFLYDATDQLRRFFESHRERLREVGPLKLVDDDQDYLVYQPVDETWVTRLTYQDPADSEWYDEEQVIDALAEIVELYNPADILAWLIEAARDPVSHLVAADELASEEAPDDSAAGGADDWQAELPSTQQETLAAQRLWQLADAYRGQIGTAQSQLLREFAANAEEVLRRTGDMILLDEGDETLILRSDGYFETALDLSDQLEGALGGLEPRRSGLTVANATAIAGYYDPADVLQWVTEALNERYPTVDFSAVYE